MTEQPTAYHDSVTSLRRELMQESANWSRRKDQPPVPVPYRLPGGPVSRAYTSSLMAANYAYTLAAVLGFAGREFGEGVAHALACVADEVMTNGDFADLNADVQPATGQDR
jgi:hypothetical protein